MEESVTFKVKVQGGGEHSVSVPKEATGTELLSAVRRVLGGSGEGELRVLLAGKRVTDEIAVSSLRNSSPLLVLGAGVASPQSSPLRSSTPAVASASSPNKASNVSGMSDDEARRRNEADRRLEMENAKLDKLSEAALAFSRERGDDGGYFAEIVDNNGRTMQLPQKDKENLIAAQVLHEHGKKLMEQNKHEDAIRVLRDALKLFQAVSPALLKIIDNYGLCSLDCAWAYLKCGDVVNLPLAREQLVSAKFALELAHGKNLERLMQVRGEDYLAQKTLYVRLALLQGVVAWHRGEHVSAQSYLCQAEDLARALRIDDAEIAPLLEMGYSKSEARRGLRVSNKDVEQAVVVIMTRREQLQQQARDRRRQRRQERIGKTVSGNYVDLEMFDGLVGMGFDERLSAMALRQSDNDLGRATEILTSQPELLTDSDGGRRAQMMASLNELAAMGFTDRTLAKRALRAAQGNVEQAANMLLGGSAENLPVGFNDDNEDYNNDEMGNEGAAAEDNRVNALLQGLENEENRLKREREEEVREAAKADLINAINRDADHDAEDEFDLNLDDEILFIDQYKTTMAEAGKWRY